MSLLSYSLRGGRGGRSRGRLLIGVIIAIIGLLTYFMNTQENPITGEKQRVGNLSPQDEVKLGYNAMPELVQQMGGKLPDSDARSRLMNEVGQRLVRFGRLEKSPYEFSFTVLNDPQTVNAFALPGGPVFITRALFEQLDNEAQLAGVVGHEIGHVVHRHGAQRMAKGQLGQTLSVAVGVGAGGDDGGQMAHAAAAMASHVLLMKYSREDELESDDQGLQYMIDAGYDPREMVRVMEILKKASGGGGRGPDFMASHPHPEDRVEAIRRFIEKKYPNGVPAELTKGKSFSRQLTAR